MNLDSESQISEHKQEGENDNMGRPKDILHYAKADFRLSSQAKQHMKRVSIVKGCSTNTFVRMLVYRELENYRQDGTPK